MSQFQSIQNSNLSRRVSRLERELVAYRTKQLYGTSALANKIVVESNPITSSGNSIYGIVTFKGVNKTRTARVGVWINSSVQLYSVYIFPIEFNQNTPNVLKWILQAEGAQSGFTATLTASANMNGIITYERL